MKSTTSVLLALWAAIPAALAAPVAVPQSLAALPNTAIPLTLTATTAAGTPLTPALYSAQISASAPRAYWRLGETAPVSGGAAAATVGTLAGVYSGTPASAAGALSPQESNPAVRFDGSQTRVELVDNGTLDMPGNAVTLSAWVKLDQLPSALSSAYASIFESNSGAFNFILNKSDKTLRFSATDADGTVATADIPESQLVTNQWLNVVGVYSGSAQQVKVYLNGTLVAASTANAAMNGTVKAVTKAYIGCSPGTILNSFFSGAVDELAVWSRALPATEIQRNHLLATAAGFTVVSAPAHGTLSGTPPALIYTSVANYAGSDSFTFKVDDGTEESTAATVLLTVNTSPTISGQTALRSGAEDTIFGLSALTVADADGGPLTVTLAVAHGRLTLGTITDLAFSNTFGNGGFSISGTAAALNTALATLRYQGELNFNGADTLTGSVSDGIATVSTSFAIEVTAVNDAPVAYSQSVTLAEDTALPITLVGTDPDSAPLANDPLTYQIVSTPSNGSLSSFNTAGVWITWQWYPYVTSKNLTYTPRPNFSGSDSFVYRVYDGRLYSDYVTVSFTVTAVNDAPSFKVEPALEIAVNQGSGGRSWTSVVTNISPGDVYESAQTVAFTVANNNNAIFSVQPTLSATGTLSFTPASNSYGSATLTASVTDSLGASSASQTFMIITVRRVLGKPVLVATPVSAAITSSGALLGGEVTASDAPVIERGVEIQGVVKIGTSGTLGAFAVSTTRLKENTTYTYRAYATSSVGTGYSAWATFTTLAQASLSPAGTQYLRGNYYTAVTPTTAITPTGMSGTVSYSVSPSLPAGLSLDTATGVISGTPTALQFTATNFTITGRGASSGIATATVQLTVSKAALTVTAVNRTRVYGAANPGFSVAFSGFVNGDSSAVVSGVAGLTTTATSTSSPGTYAITASLGTLDATNYSFGNFTAATLTIDQAPQTVTIAPLASSVPLKNLSSVNLSARSSTGLPVTLSLGAGSAATLSGTPGSYFLTDIGTTGTVTVLANQAGDANYAAATEVVATFDVTKANQTITFGALADETYGTSPIALSASSDSGQAVSYTVVSGRATVTGSSLQIEGAGSVVIRATQAGTDFYNAATAVEQAFTVSPKSLTVTGAVAADKVADESSIATLSGAELVGAINFDDVRLANAGVGSFSQATVGTGLTVTTSITLIGTNAGNYTLTQPTLTASITAAAITHTHQELWRFAFFGTYLSEVDAADDADPDHDSLNNLLEYALGMNPTASNVAPTTLVLTAGNLEYTYTRSTGAQVNGAAYQILWSDTLETGSWSTQDVAEEILLDDGTLQLVKVTLPASPSGKRFLRLGVVK